jgi:hypothetical protein
MTIAWIRGGFPVCVVCATEGEMSYLDAVDDSEVLTEPRCSNCGRNVLEVYMTEVTNE